MNLHKAPRYKCCMCSFVIISAQHTGNYHILFWNFNFWPLEKFTKSLFVHTLSFMSQIYHSGSKQNRASRMCTLEVSHPQQVYLGFGSMEQLQVLKLFPLMNLVSRECHFRAHAASRVEFRKDTAHIDLWKTAATVFGTSEQSPVAECYSLEQQSRIKHCFLEW